MRNFFLILAMSVLVTVQAQDTKKEKLAGSGNMVTKEVPVKAFDQLELKGVFSVVLTQGNKEELKIEAEDNLQDLFEVSNEGSKLVVAMKKDTHFDTKKSMKVSITFKKLKSMDLKTVGNVTSNENLNFDDLKISNKSVGSVDLKMIAQNLNVDNESVGNVKLNGKAENAVIRNQGVGAVQAANFIVQTMDIDNQGVGGAEVNAQKELKVKDSFLGKVTNKGAATAKRIKKVEI